MFYMAMSVMRPQDPSVWVPLQGAKRSRNQATNAESPQSRHEKGSVVAIYCRQFCDSAHASHTHASLVKIAAPAAARGEEGPHVKGDREPPSQGGRHGDWANRDSG